MTYDLKSFGISDEGLAGARRMAKQPAKAYLKPTQVMANEIQSLRSRAAAAHQQAMRLLASESEENLKKATEVMEAMNDMLERSYELESKMREEMDRDMQSRRKG